MMLLVSENGLDVMCALTLHRIRRIQYIIGMNRLAAYVDCSLHPMIDTAGTEPLETHTSCSTRSRYVLRMVNHTKRDNSIDTLFGALTHRGMVLGNTTNGKILGAEDPFGIEETVGEAPNEVVEGISNKAANEALDRMTYHILGVGLEMGLTR
ncbi:hypothetical protein GQ44DRAFT_44662 [Phaeosphaeriaceae sp. PMI808]|nr:hypothetical protein GQ44DRAFT_44662 [Phaeosphaeriaceae sp. PMI808]